MTDILTTVIPKSDQLNSDDLIAGPLVIRVAKVTIDLSKSDQPVSIFFDGDNGKPFKPCKSMRRVLIEVWGSRHAEYVGRSMTLYRDPSVKFGGFEVGGIRISHMSNIDRPITMALTATRASRKPFTVQPLAKKTPPKEDSLDEILKNQIDPQILDVAREAAGGGSDIFKIWWEGATQTDRAAAMTIKDELTKIAHRCRQRTSK